MTQERQLLGQQTVVGQAAADELVAAKRAAGYLSGFTKGGKDGSGGRLFTVRWWCLTGAQNGSMTGGRRALASAQVRATASALVDETLNEMERRGDVSVGLVGLDPEDPMYSSRTDAELRADICNLHAECTRAGVTGAMKFKTAMGRPELIACCEMMHAELTKRGAVPQGSGPGLRRLRNDPRAETIRQQTLADHAAALPALPKTETKMVQAATAEAGNKKAAAATTLPRGTVTAEDGGTVLMKNDMIIRWRTQKNPYNEEKDKEKHAQFELGKAHDGKTVGEYRSKGGKRVRLATAVHRKQAGLEAPPAKVAVEKKPAAAPKATAAKGKGKPAAAAKGKPAAAAKTKAARKAGTNGAAEASKPE
jgi:hypothetical protein